MVTLCMVALLIAFFSLFAGLVVFAEGVIAPRGATELVRDRGD